LSPLATAIVSRQWNVCALLRSLGADDVPLVCEAVARGNSALLKQEVRKNRAALGTDPSQCLQEPSLFHLAVKFNQARSVKDLASLGGDVNRFGTEWPEGPAVALACQEGDLAMVKTLVACGAKLEWPGSETATENGLYYAVLGSHLDVVRYLLDKGLDPNVTRAAITGFLGDDRRSMQIARMLVSSGFVPDKKTIRQNLVPHEEMSAVEAYLWTHSK
jgi:uncharacterized protein